MPIIISGRAIEVSTRAEITQRCRHAKATVWQAKARHLRFVILTGGNTPLPRPRCSSVTKRVGWQGLGGGSWGSPPGFYLSCGVWIGPTDKSVAMELLEVTFYVVIGVAGISIAACVWEILRWR